MHVRDNHGPCLLCERDCLEGQNLIAVQVPDQRRGLAHMTCFEAAAVIPPATRQER